MNALFAAQAFVPLALIVWMALAPPRSAAGFGIQLAASACCLWAVAWLGIWMLPPWWAPWVFGLGLLGAAGMGWGQRRHSASPWPASPGARVVALWFALLGFTSAYGIVIAAQSRSVRPPLVNLAFPLEAGRYLVVNGGSGSSTNAHLETLDAREPRFHAWRGQSYGVDLVQVDRLGLRAKGLQPADPRSYRIYGTRVLAPCSGRVVLAVDGLADLRVPETDSEHNSGNTGEPHLHVHAQRPGPPATPLSGDPLPILFNGRFPVRGDRIDSP